MNWPPEAASSKSGLLTHQKRIILSCAHSLVTKCYRLIESNHPFEGSFVRTKVVKWGSPVRHLFPSKTCTTGGATLAD
jgi:hypothetical protein